MSGSMSGSIGGRQVTVAWSEAQQNFVITNVGASGPVPNVAGTWRASLNYVTEDCNFLTIPPDLPTSLTGTFTVTQNGAELSGTAGILPISGEVEPDGSFSIIVEPQIETVSSTCSVAFLGGYAGNFLEGDVIFLSTVNLASGSCPGVSLPCSILYAGTLSRSVALSEEGALSTDDLPLFLSMQSSLDSRRSVTAFRIYKGEPSRSPCFTIS